MKIGDKINLLITRNLNREELTLVKSLDFILTVEDLDIVNNEIYGLYTKELPGYLIPFDDVETNIK